MAPQPLLDRRRAGILLHPTSLPGPWPWGVLGEDARRFADLLGDAGVSVWQCLPVGPVGSGDSPYQLVSAFAGNPRLVDPAATNAAGTGRGGGDGQLHARLLHDAWDSFRRSAGGAELRAFAAWRSEQRDWLLPYALFTVCRRRFGNEGWWHWPEAVRERRPEAMSRIAADEVGSLARIAFEQYLFDRQWAVFRAHARSRGVYLFGDIPIYMDRDSVDVWWHRRLFDVDTDGQPRQVAGVPPDYFAKDGQLWGNPLYDWDQHRRTGFRWWIARFRMELRRFDLLRIDHFRALAAYWAVPSGAATAREGEWVEGPGEGFLRALAGGAGELPLVAEDLGTITPDVLELRDRFGLPGMLVLQFAFDGNPGNPYLPENHVERAVVYTGTHDNDTLLGWYRTLDESVRDRVRRRFHVDDASAPGAVLDAAWQSPARLAVVPLQDLLGLGSEARMNTPGEVGHWTWRFDWEQVPPGFADRLRPRLEATGRAGPAVETAGQSASVR